MGTGEADCQISCRRRMRQLSNTPPLTKFNASSPTKLGTVELHTAYLQERKGRLELRWPPGYIFEEERYHKLSMCVRDCGRMGHW